MLLPPEVCIHVCILAHLQNGVKVRWPTYPATDTLKFCPSFLHTALTSDIALAPVAETFGCLKVNWTVCPSFSGLLSDFPYWHILESYHKMIVICNVT